MSRKLKAIILAAMDFLAIYAARLAAIVLVYGVGGLFRLSLWTDFLIEMPLCFILFELVLYAVGVGRAVWLYAGLRDILKIFLSAAISSVLLLCGAMAAEILYDYQRLLINVYVIFGIFLFCGTLFLRVVIREYLARRKTLQRRAEQENGDAQSLHCNYGNVMIIGCGDASMIVLNMLKSSGYYPLTKVCCLIDDDPDMLHRSFCGVPVVGNRYDIVKAAEKYQINTIVFGIASCDPQTRSEFFDIITKTDCKLMTVPTVDKILSGELEATALRSVSIEDLLERESIELELDDDKNYLKDQVVLVTGGGGSIGSELCRQIAKRKPKKLIIFDVYENSAYDIQNELRHNYPDLDLLTLIGSVRDLQRLDSIFEEHHIQIVFHAAAHKHVPLMEDSPHESIKNNVFGTYNTAMMADKYHAKRFVLISTDKAVNPTNIMGASKRICEMIVQYFSRKSQTEFVAVRFGNVLGSNGSVIPLFKKQIENGGPVTVTHPDIIRYFMTIPEAVSLVLEAGADAHGGEIFVLDMGKPVKILTLAENMIRLSGYIPYKTMQIEFSGLRPGEKLYEELLMDEEGLEKTANQKIYIGHLLDLDDELFSADLHRLKELAYDENSDIRQAVAKLVPTYHYQKEQSAHSERVS